MKDKDKLINNINDVLTKYYSDDEHVYVDIKSSKTDVYITYTGSSINHEVYTHSNRVKSILFLLLSLFVYAICTLGIIRILDYFDIYRVIKEIL